ncbi:MAG TPA: TOBE domain-containing protein, partial [Pseudolabrys sp.]|nr:TOBE domain-containing protein [Pseudolabrys sp.]
VPLCCVGQAITAGAPTPVSVRPHDILISTAQPAQAENVLPATVVRQVFLGGSRDYMVEVAGGTQVRIITGAAGNIGQGSTVWLYLPPEKCRALSG